MSNLRAKKVKALLEKFRIIASERLERLNNSFLGLESRPDDQEAAATLVREIHTLKGEAKLMGFETVNLVAHKTEDLIFRARDQEFRVSEELSHTVLEGLDVVANLVAGDSPVAKARAEAQAKTFMTKAAAVLEGKPAPQPAAPSPPLAAGEPKAVKAERPEGLPQRLQKPTEAAPEPTGPVQRTTIRVDVDKLDFLADRVADLARHYSQIEQVFKTLRRIGDTWRVENRDLQRLAGRRAVEGKRSGGQAGDIVAVSDALQQLQSLNGDLLAVLARDQELSFARENAVQELESAVRDLRLVPLSSLFGRFPRAMRDLAREQGKRIRLDVQGGELEVDKRVLDHLDEPLLHLFRNAIDHGVEAPEVRRKQGKSADGLVSLTATQGGSHVEIAISDDGQGLSPEVIRDTAIARGVIEKAEANLLPDDELVRLVLRPGFSTREQASDVSGRGVGLDVVRDRVETLGGSVGITGEPGLGTTVRLRVPVSVALMPAMVVRLGETALAFPSHSVASVVDLATDEIESAGKGTAFRFGDSHVPLEDLPALLGVEADRDADEGIRALVVEDQGRLLGLEGGKILAEQELMLRPLDEFLRGMPLFVGTAVLDQGDLAFIVSVSELMRRAELVYRPQRRRAADRSSIVSRTVLLAEDSELIRDMLEGILRGLGHEVVEAANGRDAVTQLGQRTPDLIITDLEMPVMDGFELIEHVRGDSRLADVPIVVLSSRGSKADKQRAAELGADAYLVKSDFKEEVLAETMNRFFSEGTSR